MGGFELAWGVSETGTSCLSGNQENPRAGFSPATTPT